MPVAVVVLAPSVKRRYGLSLSEVGVLLACVPAGGAATALAWGYLADRGERRVMTLGLASGAVLMWIARLSASFSVLAAMLILIGAAGSSASAASGRAVMGWFRPHERGLALAIRQAAVPLGGFASAVFLAGSSVEHALTALAVLNAAAAVVAAALIQERSHLDRAHPPPWLATVRSRRLLRLATASTLLSTAKVSIAGFAVLFLTEIAGFRTTAAGQALAAIQLGGMLLRILAGRWSDRDGRRLAPMYQIAVLLVVMSLVIAIVTPSGPDVLVPLVVAVGALSLAWNGLSFTATAELAGWRASGTALGLQQTALGVWAFVAAPIFGTVVGESSWTIGFLFIAVVTGIAAALLRPLIEPVQSSGRDVADDAGTTHLGPDCRGANR